MEEDLLNDPDFDEMQSHLEGIGQNRIIEEYIEAWRNIVIKAKNLLRFDALQ